MANNQLVLIPITLEELTELFRGIVAEHRVQPLPETLPQKLITEKELCQYLGISLPTAIRYRQKRKIPFVKIGSSIRYNVEEVLKALTNKAK